MVRTLSLHTETETETEYAFNDVDNSTKSEQNKTQYSYIPPKKINGHNFQKMKSFKDIRRKYKVQHIEDAFKKSLEIIFKEFSIHDHGNDLNDELLLEVMNFSEKFFLYPNNYKEREEIKKKSVCEVMKPYYRDDEKLVLNSIKNLKHLVNKVGFLRRYYIRLKIFFKIINKR